MKIVFIVFRVLLGLLLLFASISYFFNLIPEPIQTGNIKVFNDGFKSFRLFDTLGKIN